MDSASGSPQFENKTNSSSKDEGVEWKVDNSCTPTRGTFKKGMDSGFNDVQICSSRNKTAAVMSSMLVAANTVRAAACEGECGYVLSEKEKKMTIEMQILEADAICKEKWEQIHKRWKDLMLSKAPQELAQHISEQCKADKKIHEEQLGWVWCPPPKDIFLSFGSFLSSEKKEQAKHTQVESESCRNSCASKRGDMPGLQLNDQSNEDESTDQDSVRSSHLANYKNKPADLPSIAEIERIWTSYGELIAPKVLRVWACLAAALVSYNQLLKTRGKLMHEVYFLSQQRNLMQGALNHFLSSKGAKTC